MLSSVECPPDPLRRGGHVDVFDAERLGQGIDECRRSAYRARFTTALDAEWIGCGLRHCEADPDVGQIIGARHTVVHVGPAQQLPGVAIVYRVFQHGLAQPLGNTAMNLTLYDHRIDQRAEIVDSDEIDDRHHASVGVDLQFTDVAARGVGEVRRIEKTVRFEAGFDPPNFTFPAGCHICELEVDPDTGVVTVVDFVAVDDFGALVNPMIVEGQVHGGVAQGLGQAMLERTVYDSDTGQLLSGSYMDYCMPRADDLPNIRVGFTVTKTTSNPLGIKGCGEAGAIGAPPAFINALTDALEIEHIDMPATPERVWRALHARTPTTHGAHS